MGKRILRLLLLAAVVALVAAGAFLLARQEVRKERVVEEKPAAVQETAQQEAREEIRRQGRSVPAPAPVVFLSDLSWDWATTGWVALADDHLPKLDASFLNGVITIGEKTYGKGIGTFPLSEVVYPLGGRYRVFQADVGVDGAVGREQGSVVFKLFLDDVLAYDSGVVRSGMEPKPVAVSVAGIEKLKLVVEDAGDGSALDYADWANARLTLDERPGGRAAEAARRALEMLRERIEDHGPEADAPPARQPTRLQRLLEAAREERRQARQEDWATVRQRSEEEIADLARVLEEAGSPDSQATGVFDEERGRLILVNDRLAITLGYGGDKHGLLSVLDRESNLLVAYDTTPSLTSQDFTALVLSRHTVPREERGYWFRRVVDPVLGPGLQVRALFQVPGVDVTIIPRITLFDEGSYFTYRLQLEEAQEDIAVRNFTYFDPDKGGYFVVGEEAAYLTDYSLPRRAEVRDDSILRREQIGLGKPLLLYDKARARGLVMAIIDEVPDPARFSLQLETGRVVGRLGFEHRVPEDVRAALVQNSPRLFFHVTSFEDFAEATGGYRQAMAARYPPPPIPGWVKYQWGTWYAFGMNYDEATLKEQVDYIDQNLADLGPWSILLDAGWYVAEGRPGSDWVVDDEKFPNGLRAVADYAHARGIMVVIYFSAPYLDDRDREGNWLGLRGFIEEHPDWVLRLQADSSGASYVYDFTKPEVVQHFRKLIADFFRVYDVDGIKIDGLGQAEGEQLIVQERDIFGDVNSIRMFTMDIYRLIHEAATTAYKDAYIESGWGIPIYANQYAHTFRYGDEFPDFSARYPQAGLLEHIDYAALQKAVLGQRPNMGMVWGGAESQRMVRQWFEAALAMGTQMTLSIDFTHLSTRDLSALRAVLLHYNGFEGKTRFVGLPQVESFATTGGPIAYLGAVNRLEWAREITFKLSDYGLEEGHDYLLYDVSSASYSKVRDSFTATLNGSSFRLFLLCDGPGVVWSNSSHTVEADPSALTIKVDGPSSLLGFVQVHTPPPAAVRLDGRDLSPSPTLRAGTNYWYDEDTGVLRLRYRHDRPHIIEVSY